MITRIIHYGRTNPVVRRYPVILQITKFAIIGVFNFILDFSIYWYLTRTMEFMQTNYLLAHSISFLAAVTSSFLMNRAWTFRAVETVSSYRRQYIKFFTVSLGGLLLSSLLLYLVVSHLQIMDLIGKFLVAIVVMFWNFSLNKLWTFRAKTYEA